MPRADTAPVGHRLLPGVGSWWWHGGPTGQHHPIPTCRGRGSAPSLQPLARGAQIPPARSPLPPGCESHHAMQEPLHLKGHRALKSVAWGGRGGLTPCRHLFAGRFPACHPHWPVPQGEVLPVGGAAHGPARATSPVPAPWCGSSGTVPICGDGGKPHGPAGTLRRDSPSESPRPAEGGSRQQPLPSRSDPSRKRRPLRGANSCGIRDFFVNLFFSLILKKIYKDFPGNKSLTYSCQQAEVGEWALGLLQTFWHQLRHHESP